jgi:hypothetical protein
MHVVIGRQLPEQKRPGHGLLLNTFPRGWNAGGSSFFMDWNRNAERGREGCSALPLFSLLCSHYAVLCHPSWLTDPLSPMLLRLSTCLGAFCGLSEGCFSSAPWIVSLLRAVASSFSHFFVVFLSLWFLPSPSSSIQLVHGCWSDRCKLWSGIISSSRSF